MPPWIPPIDQVGPDEHIGRRLFDEPMLVGAKDQKSLRGLDVRHFEEARGNEFSVDRLGRSSVDRSAVRCLRPLADAHGRSFRRAKTFNGWIVLRARNLQKPARGAPLPVVPSPEEHNRYHAHVDTQKLFEAEQESERHYFIALHLRELFAMGTVHPVADQPQNEGLIRFVPLKFRRWLSTRLKIQIIV
jgi:hypothetical protein